MTLPTEVLLITGSIEVGNTRDVKIRDRAERQRQYLEGLLAWITLTDLPIIVFCENTNTSYDFTKIIKFARLNNKILEVLVFSGNHKAQIYGKGYGEGEIVDYAMKYSQYLSHSQSFYKVTGRLFVKNFNQIKEVHAHLPNVFKLPAFAPDVDPFANLVVPEPNGWAGKLRAAARYLYVFFGRGRGRGPHDYRKHAATVFYKCNVDFFKKNLLNSYKRVNETKSYVLEHVIYEDLAGKNFSPFLVKPEIVGRSGSTGITYDGLDYSDEIKRLTEDFMQVNTQLKGAGGSYIDQAN
jgi:hypothetical protein